MKSLIRLNNSIRSFGFVHPFSSRATAASFSLSASNCRLFAT
jgi:hypothetical protein